jgi:RNA polymerase sigma-70 factor (ECF subfamily)
VHLPERREDWGSSHAAAPPEQEVLDRYLDAWERRDLDSLAELLKEDVRLSMPPTPAWVLGRADVLRFFVNYPWRPGTRRHVRVATRANRLPAYAIFQEDSPGAPAEPFGLEVIRIEDGLIAGLDYFLQPELIERFTIDAPA